MELNIQNYADVHCAVCAMKRIGIAQISLLNDIPTMIITYEKAKELFPNQNVWKKDSENINGKIKFTNYHIDDEGFRYAFCNLEFVGEKQ